MSAFADGAGGGMRFDVADAEVPAGDSFFTSETGAFAREQDAGLAGGVFDDFNVGPCDLPAPSGAQDFEDGFLGGKASGVMLHAALLAGVAIFLLGGSEDAVEEMVAVLFDKFGDSCRLYDVDAVSDDGHGCLWVG